MDALWIVRRNVLLIVKIRKITSFIICSHYNDYILPML